MVRVLLGDRDTELAVTRLVHRRSSQLLNRCQVVIDLCGNDIILNNKDVEGAWLRRRPLALHWQKPRRKAKCYRKASHSKRFQHWFPPFFGDRLLPW